MSNNSSATQLSRKATGLIALGLASACANTPQRPTLTVTLAPIQQRLAADCAAGRFSGVVAVRHRGRGSFLYSCGYADAERRIPLPAEGRFKLFSTSKIFTGALVLRLVEQGRMRLDQPISNYVTGAPPEWSGVTIRHLLHHQSAIPDLTEKLLEAYRTHGARSHDVAMRQVLATLSENEKKLGGAPGAGWTYSNFGYELLAHAAASAANLPFHQALQRYVLRPAGMNSTVVEVPHPRSDELQSATDSALVPGFVGDPAKWEPASSYSFVQQGAGALHAGYADLLAFDSALTRNEVLSKDSQMRNTAESVPIKEGVRYGFGWMIRSAGSCAYWQHSGGTNGYTSEFARSPDGRFAVAILSNLGFAHVSELRQELIGALIADGDCDPAKEN